MGKVFKKMQPNSYIYKGVEKIVASSQSSLRSRRPLWRSRLAGRCTASIDCQTEIGIIFINTKAQSHKEEFKL